LVCFITKKINIGFSKKIASESGFLDIVDLLIRAGADVNQQSSFGNNALIRCK